jgi:small subunit ribosomal protein S20
MANTKSAAKRARKDIVRTVANKRVASTLKGQLKKVRANITAKSKDAAKAEFQKLTSMLDKAVKTGRLHRNAAARHKSRLNSQLAAVA